MANSEPMPPEKLPPFAPPSQTSLDEALRPDDAQARDDAKKVVKGDTPRPVAFRVNHDVVGPWRKDELVGVKDVVNHFGKVHGDAKAPEPSDAELDGYIARLMDLGAFIPVFGD